MRNKEEVSAGIEYWLRARQVEAVRMDRRDIFEVLEMLVQDLKRSRNIDKLPWEVIERGLKDRAAGKLKVTDVKET